MLKFGTPYIHQICINLLLQMFSHGTFAVLKTKTHRLALQNIHFGQRFVRYQSVQKRQSRLKRSSIPRAVNQDFFRFEVLQLLPHFAVALVERFTQIQMLTDSLHSQLAQLTLVGTLRHHRETVEWARTCPLDFACYREVVEV